MSAASKRILTPKMTKLKTFKKGIYHGNLILFSKACAHLSNLRLLCIIHGGQTYHRANVAQNIIKGNLLLTKHNHFGLYQVGVVFYVCASQLCDRTWAESQSISTWLDDFSPGFLPLQNRLPVKNVCLGAVLRSHAWSFDGSLRRLSEVFRRSRLSCTFCNSALGATSKGG